MMTTAQWHATICGQSLVSCLFRKMRIHSIVALLVVTILIVTYSASDTSAFIVMNPTTPSILTAPNFCRKYNSIKNKQRCLAVSSSTTQDETEQQDSQIRRRVEKEQRELNYPRRRRKKEDTNNNTNHNDITFSSSAGASLPTTTTTVPLKSIPRIETLRNEIQKWSKSDSAEGPTKAGKALRKMFQYYNPKMIAETTNNNNKNKNEDAIDDDKVSVPSDNDDDDNDQKPKNSIKEENTTNKGRIHYTNFNSRPRVDYRDCNQVIQAWSERSETSSANAQQALIMLKVMLAMYNHGETEGLRPNTFTYNTVMNAFAQRGDFQNSHAVFQMQLTDYKQHHNTKARPDSYTFQTMIRACAKNMERNNHSDSSSSSSSNNDEPKSSMPQIAEKFLMTMNALYLKGELVSSSSSSLSDNNNNNNSDPDFGSMYSNVINCWCKSNHPEAPKRSLDLLKQMIKNANTNNIISMPTHNSDKNSTSNSVSQLQEITVNNDNDDTTTTTTPSSRSRRRRSNNRPNIYLYNKVIQLHAKKDIHGATEVFRLMKNDYYVNNNTDAEPNCKTYTILIHGWSKSLSNDAPDQAEVLLKEMIHLQRINNKNNSTNNNSNTKSNTELNYYFDGPNTVTFNTVINCWSKVSNQRSDEAIRRVRDILETMTTMIHDADLNDTTNNTSSNKAINIRPDVFTYTSVMNVYAKQGDVDGCYEVFDMMNKDYKRNNTTSNNGQLTNTVKPNIHTYNTLINAWSKSNQSQAPYEAEAILMEMIEMHSRKELNCGPDVVTYNTVLNCWKNHHPDHQSTQMTIGNPSLLSSSSPSSSTASTMNEKGPQHRAHDILKTLILKYKEEQQQQPELDEKDSHDVDDSDSSTRNRRRRRRKNPRTRIKAPRPNTFTYSIVMDAYASIGDVGGCYEVFNTMKHDYYKDGNTNAKPNLITYNTLIKAYSKARPGDLLEQRRREQQRREQKVENRVHDDDDDDEDDAAVILSIPVEIENILQEIKDRHRAGFLKEGPNKSTYRSMLVCLNKYPGTEDRVKEILRLLPDNRKR